MTEHYSHVTLDKKVEDDDEGVDAGRVGGVDDCGAGGVTGAVVGGPVVDAVAVAKPVTSRKATPAKSSSKRRRSRLHNRWWGSCCDFVL